MKLGFLLFAEFAANTDDMKMVIAGTFNNIVVKRAKPNIPGTVSVLQLPRVFLAAKVEASISDGLRHQAELRVLNEDGKSVIQPMPLGEWVFIMSGEGRPMHFQAVIGVDKMPLPGTGEYTFELWVSGKRLGDCALYVDEAK